MTITEQITADQAAVTAAQDALIAATEKLNAGQAALAVVQPHLNLLFSMELELDKLEGEAKDQIKSLVAQMRGLFNA